MAPIINLGPIFQNVTTLAWNKLSSESMFRINAGICVDQQIFDIHGFNLKTFNATTLSASVKKLANFYESQPSGRNTALVLESWPNQATIAVPDDETAYPWRDATTYG